VGGGPAALIAAAAVPRATIPRVSARAPNLLANIGERNDRAAQRSDIARRLRPLIDAWEKDVDGEAKGTQ